MSPNIPHDNIDHTIDRALATLRDAQPRPGLHTRVLASLDHHSTQATDPGAPSSRPWAAKVGFARRSVREGASRFPALTLWTATATALLAVTSLVIIHHSTPTKSSVILSERSESKNPETARTTSIADPFPTTNPAHATETLSSLTEPTTQVLSSRPERATHTLSSRPERAARSGETPVFRNCSDHRTGCPVHDDGAVVAMSGITSVAAADAQALADLHAPSHPAPPLPLTPQERLFLRMAQYRNTTQLAELDPAVRAKENADETTAFKAFFPDPPPVPQPGDNK